MIRSVSIADLRHLAKNKIREKFHLNGVNAWDYLVTIIRNKKDARSNPHLYLPWNYKGDGAESLAA